MQRPWASNDSSMVPGRCLVYGKGRKHAQEQAVPAEVWNALTDHINRKGFWHATYDARSASWDLEEPAPWQDW